jgi:hypothetical protein
MAEFIGSITDVGTNMAGVTNPDDGGSNANNFAGRATSTPAGRQWLYVMVALAGGMIGGALANRLAAAIPALAADTPSKSLAAQEILLVDARGKTHASLHLNDDGMPVLQMYDLAGKNRIGIGFAKDGAVGMDLGDQKGIQRVLLGVGDDGVPTLRLYDGSARPRMLLGVDSQGNSALDFYEHDGKLLRELP